MSETQNLSELEPASLLIHQCGGDRDFRVVKLRSAFIEPIGKFAPRSSHPREEKLESIMGRHQSSHGVGRPFRLEVGVKKASGPVQTTYCEPNSLGLQHQVERITVGRLLNFLDEALRLHQRLKTIGFSLFRLSLSLFEHSSRAPSIDGDCANDRPDASDSLNPSWKVNDASVSEQDKGTNRNQGAADPARQTLKPRIHGADALTIPGASA